MSKKVTIKEPMVPQRFEAHGTLEVSRQGQLLIVEGTGPWNLESLGQSGEQALPILDEISRDKWAALVILHGECIYVPAAAHRLTEIIRSEKRLGRVASALLVNDCFSVNFAKMHIATIYQAAGEHFEFFDDIDLAKQWLEQQLSEHQSNDTLNNSTL